MRKYLAALAGALILLGLSGCGGGQKPPPKDAPAVKISWFGQACFLIESGNKKIITDPFHDKMGYPDPKVAAELVTVSHQHPDHNAVKTVPGDPKIIQAVGAHTVDNIGITGIKSYHDKVNGAQRGENIIFLFDIAGVRICHLGDLGHLPDRAMLDQIGKVDVLLVPVGGYYTIDAAEAAEVVALIKPGYAVPMHYKTDYIKSPIAPPDDFLKLYSPVARQALLELSPGKAPDKTRVVVLDLASAPKK